MNQTEPPHVVGVCGSLRDASVTRQCLEVALRAAERGGASAALIDLREYDLPPFDPDHEEVGDARQVRQAILEADSILLGSPMYHGSYSSALKNCLDYCGFDEFENTTVGLLAVSGGRFPVTALDHLRAVCRALDAWVIPHEAAVPRSSNALEDGDFTDETLKKRVVTLGRRAVQYANIEPDPDSFEACENVGGDH